MNPALQKLRPSPSAPERTLPALMQLAQAIFPGEGARRMVLLSDGRENLGAALEQAEIAAASQIELNYHALGFEDGSAEVWMESLNAPGEIREGQELELSAAVESSRAMGASLRVFEDDRLIRTIELNLLPGRNEVQITIAAPDSQSVGSFLRFRAQILPDSDTRLQNNESSTFTIVEGPPSILVVEGLPGEGENISQVLNEASMRVSSIPAAQMPTDLAGLAEYASIVLVDVPASQLPPGEMDLLQVYVRDLGKGLVMVGGQESFGPGGYLRTPLEKTLPVDMDVRDKEIQSNLALVLAVDKSGSMGRCHCDNPDLNQSYTPQLSGQPKVDIAKEAVMRAAEAVGEQDYLGVLAFELSAALGSPARAIKDPLALERGISAIQAEGQTNLQAVVQTAYEALEGVEARRKHIILMTDGWVRTGDLNNLAQEMRSKGITLSIVAAGGGSAEYLHALAALGGGEYYPAVNIQEVPDIFLKETIQSVGKYLVEEAFYPIQSAPSPVLRGIDANNLPPLLGYNGTSPKKTARLDLITPRGDPLLASWQYGLGRAAAWTSDLKGQWAIEWLGWDGFARFTTQLVSWTLPSKRAEGLSIEAKLKENQAVVQVRADQPDGSPRNFLSGSVTMIDPSSDVTEIELEQVGAGEYQASAVVDSPGVYLLRVGINEGDQSLGQSTLGVVVPYSPEYKTSGIDQGFLERLTRTTGGGVLEDPGEAFTHNLPQIPSSREIWPFLLLAIAVLFPLDVAVRRLSINRKDLILAKEWLSNLRRSEVKPNAAQPRILRNLHEARARARRPFERTEESGSILKIPKVEEKPGEGAEKAELAEKKGLGEKDESSQQSTDSLSRLREAKKRAQRRE